MKIFVGCSSSNNIPSEYLEDAKKCLGQIFKNGYDLVFGACNNGIMGIAYDCALSNGGEITGICPELYKEDFNSLNCTKEVLTKSISERTDRIIEESDVLLFLPGGIGTIYELLTAIESKRSGEFDKPILIYNSNNYYEKVLSFFEKMDIENFISSGDTNVYKVFNSSNELLEHLIYLDKEKMVKKIGKKM